MVIRGILVLMIALTVITVPVAAQSSETEPIEGTLFFLEDGRLFRYQDGVVEPVCGIPLTTDNAYTTSDVQYSDEFNVAYAPNTGLVAIAARNNGEFSRDAPPSFNDPNDVTALYLCDVNTNEFERISPDPVMGFFHVTPVFSPDETQVAWPAIGVDTNQVLLYDIASKRVRSIYEDLDHNYRVSHYLGMTWLIWGEAGLILRADEDIAEREAFLAIIDPINGGAMAEQSLFPEEENGPEIVYSNLLTWAMADDKAVIVYALGHPDTRWLFYYDPETNERLVGRGQLVVRPTAPLPTDYWWQERLPQVNLELFRYPGSRRWGLAAITGGPETFNGGPGEFTFSPDGRHLAMLVNEGVNRRDGNDLYLLDSRETYGALGYTITAQRVGDTAHDWGESGPQKVFWGNNSQVMIIDGFEPGTPLSTWQSYPNG
jgi:hypothetical protein